MEAFTLQPGRNYCGRMSSVNSEGEFVCFPDHLRDQLLI